MANSSKPLENLHAARVSITHQALRALAHPHSTLDITALRRAFPQLCADAREAEPAARVLLERGLARMAAQHSELAALLRARFWDKQTIQQLAFEQHRSVSNLYARQAKAVHVLTATLEELEREQSAQHQATCAWRGRNLPPATWTRLFGVEESCDRLQSWLRDPYGPTLISVEGLGGIGKTSLTLAVVQTLLVTNDWVDLAWVSVSQRPYHLWATDEPSALDPEAVLEQIAWQLGWEEIARLPPPARRLQLQQALARQPYLIVIDDLEPAHHPEQWIERLVPRAQRTRFIFTTRQRLTDLPAGAHLLLRELSRAAAHELMRDEMARRALPYPPATWFDQVYDLVGGNPLALKLVVGQAVSLPFEHVLENLRAARGAPADQLWHAIYQNSWNLLTADARQTLIALTTFSPRGATYAELQIGTALSTARLETALAQLIAHALVFFDAASTRRYTLHRLTQTFLRRVVLDEVG